MVTGVFVQLAPSLNDEDSDGDLGGRDAAECGGGHGHVGRQRLRRCQLALSGTATVRGLADIAGFHTVFTALIRIR
jgi:hypothetical protein